MNRVGHGMTLLIATAIMGCGLIGLAADRLRFIFTTAADLTARWVQPAPRQERAHLHPMQYLWSPPALGRPARGLVIAIDGSDRDFRGLHAAFLRARRDLPFGVITPFVVSNGPHPDPAEYPYRARDFDAAMADPIQFDLAGIDAIICDVRWQNDAELPVYLTGFSAGGHVAWLFALEHADRLSGVAMASTNFAMRGISQLPTHDAKAPPPIRGFFGAADSRAEALLGQWETARAVVARRGQLDLQRVVIRGAGHSPFPRSVMEYFAALARQRG